MANLERHGTWLSLLALTIMLTIQVIARYVFFTSFGWIEEFSRIIFVWFLYFSMSWIVLQGRHIRIDAIELILPVSLRRWIAVLADSIWLAFNLVMTYYGTRLILSEFQIYSETPILHIPHALVHAVIPIGFGLMTVRLIQYMVRVYIKDGPEILFQTEKLEEER